MGALLAYRPTGEMSFQQHWVYRYVWKEGEKAHSWISGAAVNTMSMDYVPASLYYQNQMIPVGSQNPFGSHQIGSVSMTLECNLEHLNQYIEP